MGYSGPLERAGLANGIQDLRFRTAEKLEKKIERYLLACPMPKKKNNLLLAFLTHKSRV